MSGYVAQGFLYLFLTICLILAVLSKIPLQVLWSTIHQYQLILMVPLMGSFIPYEVTRAMLRSDFLWLPFGFVHLASAFDIHIPKDCSHTLEYENHARLHFDCFLINIFQVILPLLIILLI